MGRDNLTGPWGEALAAEYLRKKRYAIVGMNYRTRLGEIDIIAENRRFLVFCEVKLRKNARYGEAREFVTAKKQERLRAAALQYLAQNPTQKQPRFDVVEIYAPEGMNTEKLEINHLENAF